MGTFTKEFIDSVLNSNSTPTPQQPTNVGVPSSPKRQSMTDIQAAQSIGRQALQDALAGRISNDAPFSYSVSGAAGIPKLEQPNNVVPIQNYSRLGYSPNEISAMQSAVAGRQEADIRREIARLNNMSQIEQNREIMAQMNAQDAIPEASQYAGLNRRIAEAQAQKENPFEGQKFEQGITLSESQQKDVDKLQKKIRTVNGSKFLSDRKKQIATQKLQSKIDDIYGVAGKTTEENIDSFLEDRKLNKQEVKEAKRILEEYDRNNPTPGSSSEKMNTLRDKVRKSESAVYGTMNALPGVDALMTAGDNDYYGWSLDDLKSEVESRGNVDLTPEERDKVNSLQSEIDQLQNELSNSTFSTGDAAVDEIIGANSQFTNPAEVKSLIEQKQAELYKTILDHDRDPEEKYSKYSTRKENALLQNPVPYLAADMGTRIAETALLNNALNNTQYGQMLDTAFGDSLGGKLIKGTVEDAPIDLATDTLPEYASNKAKGMSQRDLLNALGLNIGINTGANLGASILQNMDSLLPVLRNAGSNIVNRIKGNIDEVVDAVQGNDIPRVGDDIADQIARQTEQVNPVDLAKQNEAGVDNIVESQRQATQKLEELSQQVPETPQASVDNTVKQAIEQPEIQYSTNRDDYHIDYMYTKKGKKKYFVDMKTDDTGGSRRVHDIGFVNSEEEAEVALNDLIEKAKGNTVSDDIVNPLITETNNVPAELPFTTAQESVPEQSLPQLERPKEIPVEQSIQTPTGTVPESTKKIVDDLLDRYSSTQYPMPNIGADFNGAESWKQIEDAAEAQLKRIENFTTGTDSDAYQYAKSQINKRLKELSEQAQTVERLKAAGANLENFTLPWDIPSSESELERLGTGIKKVLDRIDLSADKKLSDEADKLMKSVDDYKQALQSGDQEAIAEAKKAIRNAGRRFDYRVDALKKTEGWSNIRGLADYHKDFSSNPSGKSKWFYQAIESPSSVSEQKEQAQKVIDEFLAQADIDTDTTWLPEFKELQTPPEQPNPDVTYDIGASPVQRQDIPNVPDGQKSLDELFNRRYADEAVNGGGSKSKLGTNTFTKMDAEQAAIEDSKGLYNYVSKEEKETMQAAADNITRDAEGSYRSLLEKSDDAFTSTDVDTSMMLRNRIKSELEQAREAGDAETVNYLTTKLDALTRRQRKAATNAGQVSQAWAKWSRNDADSALMASDALKAKKAADVSKSNPKYTQKVKDFISDIKDAINKLTGKDSRSGIDLEFFGKKDEESEAWKVMEQHLLDSNVDDMTEEEISKDIEDAIRQILDKQENAKLKKNLQNQNIKKYADTLAREIKQGDSINETLEMLETAGVTGFTDIDDAVRQEVEDLFSQAEKLGFDSAERVKLENQAYAKIANALNLQGSWHDKVDSLRYFAMLANPKTHLRNIAGNWTFRQMTNFKDNLAGLMEAGIDRVSKNGIERTTTVIDKLGKDKDLYEASYKNAADVSRRLEGGDKYLDAKRGIEGQKAVWGYSKPSQVVNKVQNANTNLLELEDTKALRRKYADSLTRYLKANGADKSIFNATDDKSVELLAKAQEHAIDQAKRATFHQDNKLAEGLSKFIKDARDINVSDALYEGNAGAIGKKVAGLIADATLPFKKTPLNILSSVGEYSPANLVAIGNDIVKLAKGTEGAANRLIDDIAKTATGTTMLGIGYALAKNGIITSSFDPERGNQDKLEGKQEYALKIGDKSYTLNWLSPALTMALTGANLAEADLDWSDVSSILSVFATAGDPVLEETMLSSLADALSSAKYADGAGDVIANFAGNAAKNYATQFVPTELGNISRSIDNTRRSTYSQYTGLKGTADRTLKSIENKIPVLSKNNQPSLNAWGEEQTNVSIDNLAGRLAYNHLSPGFYSQENLSDADRYLEGLYELSPDKSLFPKSAQANLDGERLTPEQYTARQKAQGQTAKQIIEAISKDQDILSLSPDMQKRLVGKAYDEANNAGKAAVNGEEYSLDIPTLLDSYKYDGIMRENGLVKKDGSPWTSQSAQDAYDNGQLEKYKEYRQWLEETGKKDKLDLWQSYANGGTQQELPVLQETQPTQQAITSTERDVNGKLVPQYNTPTTDSGAINWSAYGLTSGNSHKNMSTSYSQALGELTGLTPKDFADQWKAIDADGSGTMKKQEIINYLNATGVDDKDKGINIYHAYRGSKTWKDPSYSNGVWK